MGIFANCKKFCTNFNVIATVCVLVILIIDGFIMKSIIKQKKIDEEFLKAVKEDNMTAVLNLVNEQEANIKYKRSTDGITALHVASENGYLNMTKYLISHKVYIDARNENGSTALHEASKNDKLEILEFLIENKANVTAKARYDMTALHYASMRGYLEIVECLIEHNAEVNFINAQNVNRSTALHEASKNDNLKIVKCLIENKADITAKDKFDMTALHYVSMRGYLQIVKCLVEHNAEDNFINAKNDQDRSALDLALQFGRTEVAEYLKNAGGNSRNS